MNQFDKVFFKKLKSCTDYIGVKGALVILGFCTLVFFAVVFSTCQTNYRTGRYDFIKGGYVHDRDWIVK